MDRKLKEAIWSIMENEDNLEQNFVIDLLKERAPMPDVENLKNKEYKRMANTLISSYKDEKGVRDIFTIRNNEDLTAYINVAKSKKVEGLKQVQNRLEKNISGNQKSLSKVQSRLYLLENQVTFEDLKNEESL